MTDDRGIWGLIDDFKPVLRVVGDNYVREIWAYEIVGVGVAMTFTGQNNEVPFSSSSFIEGTKLVDVFDENDPTKLIGRKVVQEVL